MVTAGAAQESLLGSDLWIVAYYGLIKLKLPEGCQIEGYADDFTLTITAQTDVLLQYKLNHAMRKINQWITEHGLDLDAQKKRHRFSNQKKNTPLTRDESRRHDSRDEKTGKVFRSNPKLKAYILEPHQKHSRQSSCSNNHADKEKI